MTVHPISSSSISTGARRLLDGAGIATVAVRGSKNRSDVMVSAAHRWVGDGAIVVTGTPAPWSGLIVEPGESVEVVVMIDEYAPIVEAKVHVASLYAFGLARAARRGDEWLVEVEIQLGEVDVRRLGREGTVDARLLDSVPSDPLAAEVSGLADEIRARFGGDRGRRCRRPGESAIRARRGRGRAASAHRAGGRRGCCSSAIRGPG